MANTIITKDPKDGTHALTVDDIYEFPGKSGQPTGYEAWCKVRRDLTPFWCDYLVVWTVDPFAVDVLKHGKDTKRPVLVSWVDKEWGREITGCELYQ